MAGAPHPLPHRYHARAAGTAGGNVIVGSTGLAAIATQAPPEFGGPGGFWSPETLLLASVADCYVLTFRAVARAAPGRSARRGGGRRGEVSFVA